MSRRTRKQMVGKVENAERALREMELQYLRRELQWRWRVQANDRPLTVA